MNAVALIDYGIGNLFSVSRALEHSGAKVTLASHPEDILRADRIVLPGVGAFKDGMEALRSRDLVVALKEFAKTGRPLMGICLGAQLLFDSSDEFGQHEGLSILSGTVKKIPEEDLNHRSIRVPNIGWSRLEISGERESWENSILKQTNPSDTFYFVHSFSIIPDDAQVQLAACSHGGHKLTAAIQKDSVSGCQFHPEKSGLNGLKILETFISS